MFSLNNIVSVSDEASLAYCQGKLFMRDKGVVSAHPLQILDQETLLEDNSEEFQAFEIKNKRNIDTDEWNRRIIESTDNTHYHEAIEKKEHELYRVMQDTPVFSDGQLLYFVSHWTKGEIGDREDVIDHVEIEAYCPHTWAFKQSFKLSFEPEESAQWTTSEQSKIGEDTEKIRKAMISQIHSCVFATNGSTLAVGFQGTMFFFDLKSGSRHRDVINIPNTKGGGYDPASNTFWYYKEDVYEPILKSFKVDGFSSVEELNDNALTNFPQFSKRRTLQVVNEQKVNKRIEPRNVEKFLKQLGNRSTKSQDLDNVPGNSTQDLSLFLIMYTLSKGCENIDSVISELDKLYPDLVEERLVCQTKLFRSQYAVSISNTFVEELVAALKAKEHFLEEQMSDENILVQYQFLWLLTLVHRFVLSLDRLKLSIAEVSEDSQLRKDLYELISNLTGTLSEQGSSSIKIS